MFGNDAEFLLTIHRSQATQLQAEATADGIARALSRRRAHGWLGRRRRPGRTDARR